MEYVADFETTTDPEDCRVWAWAVCEIENPDNLAYGTTIATFIDHCRAQGGEYYFHNLAFDGEFILHHLLTHGYVVSTEGGLKLNEIRPLISDMGKFYQIEVCFGTNKKKATVTFKDSLKKLPMSVAAIAKAFKLPISKLEIDYEAPRAKDHALTPEEIDYITNDVQIVAHALKMQFDKGLTRLTVGSDALYNFKTTVNNWQKWFPVLPLEFDADIRRAYKGGYTYADERYRGVEVGAGCVFDVNSLYPDVMYNCDLPWGHPVLFDGQYQGDDIYPLYVQRLTCSCTLKPDHIPTLQIKGNPLYNEGQYLSATDGYVQLMLTNVDLDILFDHYNVDVDSYDGGYKFKWVRGIFKDYIDYWSEVKATSTGGQRQLAKLMLNSLYGKFATNPDVTGKVPFIRPDGAVGYKLGDPDTRDPVYTPLACFVTAYARQKTITAAQAVYDRFLYADTDSLHLLGTEIPDIEVHPTKLGAWKHESNFDRAKYVRAKTYLEHITQVGAMVDGEYVMQDVDPYNDVKCAGLPSSLKHYVTFDNFKSGLQIYGKLRPKHVRGGIVLEKTTFTIL